MPTSTWRNQLGESERLKIVQKASECLWTVEGQDAFKYLKEERGLSEATIREFQIGFVPLRVSHQLSGRIITPIFDAYGEVVALSTRHLYKPKSEAFWHEDFDKSFYLYGLHIAKKHILRTKKALIVEGEFDVSFMHSSDIPITVGLCGNSMSDFQVSLLARYCKDIYLLYDGDGGGKMGLERSGQAFKNVLAGGSRFGSLVNLIPVRLPKGMDPDDYVIENSRNGLIKLMKSAKAEFDEWGYNGVSIKE